VAVRSPFCFGADLAIDRFGHSPDMFGGVIIVDDLDPLPEVLGSQVPDPGYPIAEHHHGAQLRQAMLTHVAVSVDNR
jgi:hypothetical protein